LRSQRQLAREYKTTLDWAADVPLEAEIYTSQTQYDALNRPTALTAPDSSVIRPTYNEANLLERVEVNLRGTTPATSYVSNIDYDAKGQRVLLVYGNDVRTSYEYDPRTLRLIHLQTLRGAEPLQDLHYTYDPVGNITRICNDAQQTIFFRNQRIDPSNDYVYDAIYRLIEATGREHLGQTGGQLNTPTTPDAFNTFHMHLEHPGDGNAMGRYIERYVYDAVDNILAMQHRGSDPSHAGWTRNYTYDEPSLIEPDKNSNRLSSTTVGSDTPEIYPYDAHGNMAGMPPLSLMQWDYRDQLQATARQVVNNGTPETTYYVYDSGGQRIRKVTERHADTGLAPTRMKERIYLGGFEIFREYKNDGETVGLERETLHVMDDQQRIALVETRTEGDDGSPAQLIRYQFGNHLGSASLELDDQVQVISYEEYFPYGCTSYQAVQSGVEVPKRYRFTGKERDEESGLYYHGARYYACWLGRWLKCDPYGLDSGLNLYDYGSSNPIKFVDPAGTAPKKYEDQRGKDTAKKRGEMKSNLEKAEEKKFTLDPMQKRAEMYKQAQAKRGKQPHTPIEHHHHKGVNESAKVGLDPKKMESPMSSVWSKRGDPLVQAGIGDVPMWDPKFKERNKRTHHTIAKEIDFREQKRGPYDTNKKAPRTAKALEDAAESSKQIFPAVDDMTARAGMDWSLVPPDPTLSYGKTVGPSKVDPDSPVIKQLLERNAKMAEKLGLDDLKGFDEFSGKSYGDWFRNTANALEDHATRVAKQSKVIPILGVAAGVYSAKANFSEGKYVRGGLDVAGLVYDPVDIAVLAWDKGVETRDTAISIKTNLQNEDYAEAALDYYKWFPVTAGPARIFEMMR
jgi:RHS repeat-associated protein